MSHPQEVAWKETLWDLGSGCWDASYRAAMGARTFSSAPGAVVQRALEHPGVHSEGGCGPVWDLPSLRLETCAGRPHQGDLLKGAHTSASHCV